MNYELKKVYESYKAYVVHIFMSWLTLTLAFGLIALFFRFLHWVFTY